MEQLQQSNRKTRPDAGGCAAAARAHARFFELARDRKAEYGVRARGDNDGVTNTQNVGERGGYDAADGHLCDLTGHRPALKMLRRVPNKMLRNVTNKMLRNVLNDFDAEHG